MSSEPARAGRRRRNARALVIYTLTLGLLVLTLFPVLWLVQMSLKVEAEAFQMPPRLLFIPTLENYRALFEGKFAPYVKDGD